MNSAYRITHAKLKMKGPTVPISVYFGCAKGGFSTAAVPDGPSGPVSARDGVIWSHVGRVAKSTFY